MHGMPLSFLAKLVDTTRIPGCEWMSKLPDFDLSQQLVYIGLRDVDKGEREIIYEHGIKAFTMSDVDRYGIGEVSILASSSVV
jgi:arginase